MIDNRKIAQEFADEMKRQAEDDMLDWEPGLTVITFREYRETVLIRDEYVIKLP